MGRFVISWLCALTLGVVFAGTVFGATGAGLPQGEGIAAPTALQQGIEHYRNGKPEEALPLLRGFVVSHYDSPELPQAYLYLARIFRDEGQYGDALLYLDRIPDDQRGPEFLLLQGACLVSTGKTKAGMETLQGLETKDLSAADRGILYRALAEGKLAQGKPLQALFFLNQGASATDSANRDAFLKKADDILRTQVGAEDLAEAAFMFDGSAIGADAVLQQALRAFDAGQKERSRKLAEDSDQNPSLLPLQA